MKTIVKYQLIAVVLWVIALAALPGCLPERTETPTKGHLTLAVSESVYPVIQQEEQRFESLYTEAHLDMITTTAREAVTHFYNDSLKLIVTSRPLNDEEREVAKRTKLDFQEYKIAVNGIAFIVNSKNPVSRLRTTQLDSIYRGLVTNWNVYGGNLSPIEVCLPDRNSATFEVVGMKVLKNKNYTTPAKVVPDAGEMINFVSDRMNAIGMVGVNWLREENNKIKVLEISDPDAPDSLGIRGQYFAPYQAHIYRGYYPVTSDVYIYSRVDMYNVGAGFISFVTSAPGQQIIVNNGLVPATMPVRLVELTNKGIKP